MNVSVIPFNNKPSSAQAMFALIDSNRDYLSRWLTWLDYTKTPADSQKFLDDSLNNMASGVEKDYFIMVDGALAGTIGVREIKKGRIKDDQQKVTGIVGYWLAEEYTGKGVTTQALKQLIEVTKYQNKESKFIDMFILRAHPDNTGSNRVAKKNGFKFQHLDPKSEKLNGKMCDLNVYYLEIE